MEGNKKMTITLTPKNIEKIFAEVTAKLEKLDFKIDKRKKQPYIAFFTDKKGKFHLGIVWMREQDVEKISKGR